MIVFIAEVRNDGTIDKESYEVRDSRLEQWLSDHDGKVTGIEFKDE